MTHTEIIIVQIHFCWRQLEHEKPTRKVGTKFREPNLMMIYDTPVNHRCIYFVGRLARWDRKKNFPRYI